jgi:hypothetical protein
MKVNEAPRRALDCYLALLEGFYPVDSPNGTVLVPEGLAGPDWEWRDDVRFDGFVASYTREFNTGVAVLSKYGIALPSVGQDALEAGVIELLTAKFGEELPPIRGMPKTMMRHKKRKRS